MTDYGRRVLENFMPSLVQAGRVIVSGMMYGVDQEAHMLCMKYGGKTIAVLGYGLRSKTISGEDGRFMGEVIDSGGLIISEWKEIEGSTWTFPQRNRIVAGLADAILVVEAAEKSGSLVTVKWAEKFGKPVYAVPGQIFSGVSMGTNKIIATGRAKIVLSAEDILYSKLPDGRLGLPVMMSHPKRTNSIASRMLFLLENEPLTTDDLVKKLRVKIEEISVALTELALAEIIQESGGKHHLIKSV